jgi:hypothetical protein
VENYISNPYYSNSSWSEAWANSLFRKKVIIGVLLFAAILFLLPPFFSIIEARQGIVLITLECVWLTCSQPYESEDALEENGNDIGDLFDNR